MSIVFIYYMAPPCLSLCHRRLKPKHIFIISKHLFNWTSLNFYPTGWMSGPIFTSPSAEVAEMNRIHYELEYTEGISQRMRIPETLKVASDTQTAPLPLQQPLPNPTPLMQVPERIVVAGEDSRHDWSTRFYGRLYKHFSLMSGITRNVCVTSRWSMKRLRCLWPLAFVLVLLFAGDDGDPRFVRPSDLDLIQAVPPVDLVNMKAPPRVLTLNEQPLDSLETDQASSAQNHPSQVVRAKSVSILLFKC